MTDPAIRVFNTMTMQKEPLVPLQPGHLGVYVCGPTVYHWVHLGNARTFASFDLVVRYLRYRGYQVKYVRNFTDVDDRILQRSTREGKTPQQFADFFVREFQEDARALGLIPPDVEPRVSEHVPEIISIIQALIARGVAYESQGDVYFQVSLYPGYARLSRRNLDDLQAGARVEPGEQKREPLDFALWKAAKPGEAWSWDSPWGKGRPGWHIECSAMARKHLGESFDIHGGALDLIFPHHENEIAQSEAATGQPFAKYWMHCGFLDLENVKMSKSLGNIVLLRDALGTIDAEALRFFFFSTHYRNQLSFSEKALHDAEQRVEYFYQTLSKVGPAPVPAGAMPAEPAKLVADFEAAMDDDFNAPVAVAVLSELFAAMNAGKDKAKLAWLRAAALRMGEVLGLFGDAPDAWLERHRERMVKQRGIDEAKVRQLLDARAAARAGKDYPASDRIRDELKAMGVEVMDTPQGQRWRVTG
ncbi:MAG TPA: cysteine--tRNA ligase [Myxococcales bacterium]|nr:cysteine--tRNA ligase [Myxococcales bacterium]